MTVGLRSDIPSRRKVTTTHCVCGAKHEEKLQLAFAAFLQNLNLHFKLHFGVLIFIFLLAFKAGTETPDKNTA